MSNPDLLQRTFDTVLPRMLGHFLWQAAALGVAGGLSLRILRSASASMRYIILTVILLGMPLCSGITFLMIARQTFLDGQAPRSKTAQNLSTVESHLPIMPNGLGTAHADSINPLPVISTAEPIPALHPVALVPGSKIAVRPSKISDQTSTIEIHRVPAIAIAYFAGVFIMLARLCLGVRGSISIRKNSFPVVDQELIAAFHRQFTRSRVRHRTQLLFCKQVLAPAVVGILKPAILLPISICSELSIDQIELLLAHELAHIRRHDQLLDLIQRMIEAFFFFHPAVWYISLAIRTEREKCCDDMVLRQGHNQLDYAGVLVRVAQLGFSSPAAFAQSAAGRRSQLRHRILRLIGSDVLRDLFPSRASALGILFLILAAAWFGLHLLGSRPARADTTPTTMPAPLSPYHIVFDNGVSVDVLAVSVVPSRHKPFWSPDGKQMIDPPYTSLYGGYKPGDSKLTNYQITLAISGSQDESPRLQTRATPGVTIGYPVPPYTASKSTADLFVVDCGVPEPTQQIDFDLGVIANRWETVRTFPGVGVYGEGPMQVSVTTPTIWEKREERQSTLSVRTRPMSDIALRLVAIDQTGGRHVSTGEISEGSEDCLLSGVFPNLQAEQIKEYRLEKCRTEWKPIKAIHLKPDLDWPATEIRYRAARLAADEQRFNPKTDVPRIDDDIDKIEHLSPFDETSDAWVSAIRDISEVGSPAVPALVAEIRRTGRPYERTGLAMALRAIDDPRAVPGVIQALADCPFAPNDYGGQHTKDPALNRFMRAMQNSDRQYDPHVLAFDFHRPVNEIKYTLVALTGQDASSKPIMDDKRSLYETASGEWMKWWETNHESATQGLLPLRFSGDEKKQNLNLAIVRGQIAEAKKLIDSGANVNLPAADGWTPLHLAAALGQLETVQYLLDHNADPDLRTADGCTPLHAAVGLGVAPICSTLQTPSIEIIQLLLDHNADARAVNSLGQTPLHGASAFDDNDLVQLLVDHGALVNAKDHRGRTPLHRAVQCECPLVVDALLSAGADVNAKDITGRAPIRMSSTSLFYTKWSSPIIKQLLGHGADAPIKTTIVLGTVDQLAVALAKHPPLNDKPENNDRSPLDWAIFQKSPEKVQLLLNAGADPNLHEADGNTPLHAAVMVGSSQIVSMLIAAKADVNAPGQEDQPPLFWATQELKADIVDLLLNAGAKPGVCGVDYRFNQISLAKQGIDDKMNPGSIKKKTDLAKRIIASLITHGADINEKAVNGFTPIFGTGGEMGELFLAKGANLDVVDDDGDTPLHYAAILSYTDAVKFLLQHKVPLDVKNKKGETPLAHCVAFAPKPAVVRMLLDAGADVYARDTAGMSVLHLAIKGRNAESVALLLDKGADPNAKDNDGLTPLHEAAKLGSDELIQLLLKHGADPGALDAGGRTPLQWATNESTIALLRSHGPTSAPK